LTWRVAANI